MIARAAEANPSCFSPNPLNDVERTLCPAYLRVVWSSPENLLLAHLPQAKYLDNNWGLTKFCVSQFKAKHIDVNKAAQKRYREVLHSTKGFDGLEEIVGSWTGEDDFREIVKMIEARPPRLHALPLPPTVGQPGHPSDPVTPPTLVTPSGTSNPEPPGSGAPLMLALHRLDLPILTGHDPLTPSPTPGGISVASI